MKVKISREARILMGLMFAAAAVLVWINFFTQQRQGFGLFGNQSPLSSSPTVSSSPTAEYVVPDVTSSALPDASAIITDASGGTEASVTGGTSTDLSATPSVTVIDPTAIGVDVAATSTDVTAIDPTAIATEASTEVTPVEVTNPSIDASVTPSGDVASSTDIVEVASTELTPEATVTALTPDAAVIADATVAASDIATEEAVALPTVAAPTAARDIQLAELPFLVTELPAQTELLEGESATALEVARPGEQRASINPFAPIVLAPVEVEAVALPDVQEIIEVPIPDEPSALTTIDLPAGVETQMVSQADGVSQGDAVIEPGAPVETLALETLLPEALTPAPEVASLPRPLPGGTLPIAPEILRTMSRPDVAAPIDETDDVSDLQPQVAEVEVAIRLPDQTPIAPTAAVEESEPAIITPEADDLDLQPVMGLASDVEAAPNGGPIAAGLSNLSRYLRDNDVRFTGSVIGPVGVGIFRSTISQAPYVITLGQTIPNTDIVLTNLQGKQAQFTQGQEVQSLTFDLRR